MAYVPQHLLQCAIVILTTQCSGCTQNVQQPTEVCGVHAMTSLEFGQFAPPSIYHAMLAECSVLFPCRFPIRTATSGPHGNFQVLDLFPLQFSHSVQRFSFVGLQVQILHEKEARTDCWPQLLRIQAHVRVLPTHDRAHLSTQVDAFLRPLHPRLAVGL